ncbi:MAG: 2-hydroxyacyl-CoA dehydratase [Oscillospiraceae bacterium]|nr:2-hydroxyacyl-CoA dehydratase [Oscillospiraceae bacterium]
MDKLRNLLDEFGHIADHPEETALAWKEKTGGKVVGVGGLDIPEPLVHAAGMLPVVLLGNEEEVTLANAHVEMHQCGYIRSLVDLALKDKLAFCDELLFHDCCHIVRMLVDALHTYKEGIPKAKFAYFSPLLEYETAQRYTASEMEKLKDTLQEISGITITDEKLSESIRLFNRIKKLLVRLYDIRREKPGILSGWDVTQTVAAGMVMPREDYAVKLEELVDLVAALPAPETKGVPVVVHGSLCERCSRSVLEEIEACGGVIVDDDLYVGSKYFNTLYNEELAPMEALLDTYLHRVSPCPTRYEERDPGDYLAEVYNRSGAKGIIMVVVKFCEAHDYLYFTAHRRFEQLGIPEMLVETVHEGAAEGQLKTRLQGFFEKLEV